MTDGRGDAAPDYVGRSRRVLTALSWVIGGLLLFWLYLAQARTVITVSEGAGQALQGWDMLHGNVLLHGWSLSDVSFWTTELPEYALVEAVRGLSGDVVHLTAALSYALMVLAAVALARGRMRGACAWAAVGLVLALMAAPQLGVGTAVLMSSPDHAGSQVALLVILLVADRAPRRWMTVVVIGLLLAWAQTADMIITLEAVVPVLIVCAIRVWQYRRRTGRGTNWAGCRWELSLAVAALASWAVAKSVLAVVSAVGGFYVRSPHFGLASLSSIVKLAHIKTANVLLMYGLVGRPLQGGSVTNLVHVAGPMLTLAALAITVRALLRPVPEPPLQDPSASPAMSAAAGGRDFTAHVLAVGVLVILAFYYLGNKPDANEVVGLLPLSAALVGRTLPPLISQASDRVRRFGYAAVAVLAAAGIGLLGFNASRPVAPQPQQELATWLQRHHLNYGLAGFWDASITTLDSGGQVDLRPVRTWHARVATTDAQTDTAWYDARKHDATFVVIDVPGICMSACVHIRALVATFGSPARTVQIGRYLVLIWHKNLLSRLRLLYWCGAAWPWVCHGPPTTTRCH